MNGINSNRNQSTHSDVFASPTQGRVPQLCGQSCRPSGLKVTNNNNNNNNNNLKKKSKTANIGIVQIVES